MASETIDLLGEPRLKNGLTYYPGVQTDKGSVILGNVVRLQLQADSVPYVGFGFLKGLWLWRDQPYIRVQYMAPSSMNLPTDAIAHKAQPDPSALPELMVTNRVGDLHLNALLGPVFIEGGPLLSQLFQENVGPDSDGFLCSRHLDPAVQRVQPLDDAFRLTPIVQAFPKTVLRAILPSPEGVANLRVPACASQSHTASVPAAVPPPPASNSAAGAAANSALAPPTPAAEAAHRTPSPLPAPPSAIVSGSSPPPYSSLSTTLVGGMGPSSSAALAVEVSGLDDIEARAHLSPGLGPKSGKASILLQAEYSSFLHNRSLTVRCPVEASVLRKRLAVIFGLVAESVKVDYEGELRQRLELKDTAELLAALERQPTLKALPIAVSGESTLHLPVLHFLASAIAIANLVCLSLWAVFSLWLAEEPVLPPYIYFVGLPPLLLVYHAFAASSVCTDEYLSNTPLRTFFSRNDGTVVAAMVGSLLGPDVLVLFSRIQLPAFGCDLSIGAEIQLLWWALGLHFLQDLPVLAINWLMHRRLHLEWDVYSQAVLATTVASLTYNLLWHAIRALRLKPVDDTMLASETYGFKPSPGNLRRHNTLRKLDTAKYVGLSNKNIVGMVDAQSMYQA